MRIVLARPCRDFARTVVLAVVVSAAALMAWPARAQLPQPLAQPNINLVTNGTVSALLALPDGSVVIGGGFISVNGVARGNIAKRRADGTLDPDWHPSIDGYVRTLATDSAGNIYAGGDFQTIDGLARRHLVKLTPAGDVVAGWDPSPDQIVNAMVVHGTDELFVGGSFQAIGGIAKAGLARVSRASGSVDAQWSPLVSGGQALALANSLDDMLVVGGSFATAGGLARRNFAKVSYTGSGAADSTWNPSPDQYVTSIAVAPDGAIFVAGSFTYFGDLGSPTGVLRWGVAKVDGNGSGAVVAAWDPFNSEQFRWTGTVAVDANGSVYLGGGLTYFGSSGETRHGVVKASATGTGSVDTAWNPAPLGDVYAIAFGANRIYAGGSFDKSAGATHLGFLAIDSNGVPTPATFDVEDHRGNVRAIAKQANGGLIIGGDFVKANGQERRRLLRLNPDGSLDMAWKPSPNGSVRAISLSADGSVFVGGHFSEINGTTLVGVAKLSGNGSGEPDAAWNPGLNNRNVSALAMDPAGFIYVGGSFGTQSGAFGLRNLVRSPVTGTGQIDDTWQPAPQGEVKALALDNSGSLFVSGSLFSIGGEDRRYLAKVLTSGLTLVDLAWNPNPNGSITSIEADGLGLLYVSGNFGMIGGQSRSRLARLSTSAAGAADPVWAPAAQGETAERIKLSLQHNAMVAVSSIYDSATGNSHYSLAKYATTGTGSIDPSWHPTVDNALSALFSDGDKLLVGGYFNQVSEQQRFGLAALPVTTPDAVFANGFDTPPSP